MTGKDYRLHRATMWCAALIVLGLYVLIYNLLDFDMATGIGVYLVMGGSIFTVSGIYDWTAPEKFGPSTGRAWSTVGEIMLLIGIELILIGYGVGTEVWVATGLIGIALIGWFNSLLSAAYGKY